MKITLFTYEHALLIGRARFLNSNSNDESCLCNIPPELFGETHEAELLGDKHPKIKGLGFRTSSGYAIPFCFVEKVVTT